MGGSGGGASGTVTYPPYMTDFHTSILDHGGTDSPESSFMDAFNVAYGASPFASAVAFNPAADIAPMFTIVTDFAILIDTLNHTADFTSAVAIARNNFLQGTTPLDSTTFIPSALDTTTLDSVAVSDGDIAADIAAMDAILTDQIEQEELPRFRAGMLNINAIHSSAYIIGEALIRASKDKALIKYGTDLQIKVSEQVREINARHALSYREITARLQTSQKEINSRGQLAQMEINARHTLSKREMDGKFYIHREELVRGSTTIMLANLMKKMDLHYQHAHLNTEARRVSLVSKKEEIEEQLAIEESDARWDLDLFRYAGILLAGPSGGVAQGMDRKSKAVSALGGAVSGAAAGAAVGAAIGTAASPGIGTAVGAVLGVGLAMLQ